MHDVPGAGALLRPRVGWAMLGALLTVFLVAQPVLSLRPSPGGHPVVGARPSVQSTLVLPTNTVHTGNYLGWHQGGTPYQVVVDPVNGLTYVTDQFVDQFYAVNSSSHRFVAEYALNGTTTGIALDPATYQLFLAENALNQLVTFDASAGRVVRVTTVGASPLGVAFDPKTSTVYVADSGGSTLTAVNASSGKVVASIPVDLGPQWIAPDFAHQRLYVSSMACSKGVFNISVVDLVSAKRTGAIPVLESSRFGGCNYGNGQLLFDPVQARLFFAESSNSTLAVIDPATAKVVHVIRLGFGGNFSVPFALAIDQAHHRLAITDSNLGNISFLDTATDRLVAGTPGCRCGSPSGIAYDPAQRTWTFAASFPPGVRFLAAGNLSKQAVVPLYAQPQGGDYDPFNSCAYFLDRSLPGLDAINVPTHRIVARIPGVIPIAMTVDPARGTVYATDGGGVIQAIDPTTQKVVRTGNDASVPVGLAFDTVTHQLWSVGGFNGAVVAYNATTLHSVGRVPGGPYGSANGIAVDSGNGRVYAGEINSRTGVTHLWAINATSYLRVAAVKFPSSSGTGPMLVDPSLGRLYVLNGLGIKLSVFNTTTYALVNTSTVGQTNVAIALDPGTGYLFVTDLVGGVVRVVSAANFSVVMSLVAGSEPYGVVDSPTSHLVLVSNEGSGTISFVRP